MKLTVPRLEGHTVLVVGDVMLDRYWEGDNLRISQEAPVPVVHVTGSIDRAGGAANVALNVVAMGARCVLIGAVGADEAAEVLRAQLAAAGVTLDLLTVPGWPTTKKLRVVSGYQQLIRLDFESMLPAEHQPELLRRVAHWADGVSAAILQDYDKGTLREPEAIVQRLKRSGVRVVVDPKHKPMLRYRGADLIKPNALEFERNVGCGVDDQAFLARAQQLLHDGCFQALLVTRGEHGMTLIERDAAAAVHLPARTVRVFDVTGAGDTVAATLGVGLAGGMSTAAAAALANVAAGIAVAAPGTVAVSDAALRRALHEEALHEVVLHEEVLHEEVLHEDDHPRGIVSTADLAVAMTEAKRAGQRIVFTNGCFDILHAGHVSYLEDARRLGDRLIVAVNSDDSVRRLKGAPRPINPLNDRMAVLAALAVVDWVVAFAEDTPEQLLLQLQPHVLVKGGDYRLDEVVGGELVRTWNGDVRILPKRDNCSTSAILARIAPSTGRKAASEQDH